jgi:hypothetical protein
MAVNRSRIVGFKPWAGLVAGMTAAGLQHQGISDAMHFDCRYGGADLVVGVAALALIALGAWLSWTSLQAHREPGSPRRFIAQMSLMAAVLFSILVLWQTMAGMILPACLP